MTRRIVLIKHNNAPNDDRAAAHLAARGFELEWRYPYAGDRLGPPDEGVAGTVVYGGAQPVTELDRHPFLAEEARWMEACLKKGLPTLGICLGAQVLCHALGAKVGPHPEGKMEFGYYELFPTEEGRDLIPEGLHVTLMHYHGFDLPAGATLLARSALYPHQALRYGDKAYGFQFHPECTRTIFKRWQKEDWGQWTRPGVQPREEQDSLGELHDPRQHAWFTGFLDGLFGRA